MSSSTKCAVLIAAADLLPALTDLVSDSVDGELLTFTDHDALRALEMISKRRPPVVALERQFAGTPRGAALVNRIKADPALRKTEIRVISHDSGHTRVSPRKSPEGKGTGTTAAVAAPAEVPAQPLDQRGTRRAPRFRIAGQAEIAIDGNPASLVDLSTIGAQVVSATVLKPNQKVRVAMTDGHGSIRMSAVVAWASFEIPPNIGPRYRAGLEFSHPNTAAVDAYCQRHKA